MGLWVLLGGPGRQYVIELVSEISNYFNISLFLANIFSSVTMCHIDINLRMLSCTHLGGFFYFAIPHSYTVGIWDKSCDKYLRDLSRV